MPATMTPDLLAHIAAVRDREGEPDDADLLVLADKLDEAANDQPTEYRRCGRCSGSGVTYSGCGYESLDCHTCDGLGTVPKPNPLRDRAELIRVGVELANTLNCGQKERFYHVTGCHYCDLKFRVHTLQDNNHAAWLSVPCPECNRFGVTAPGTTPCGVCVTTCDLLKMRTTDGFKIEPRAALTRGFLTVTLPSALCWERYCTGCGGREGDDVRRYVTCTCNDENSPTDYRPHPVLAAVLRSDVGVWVEAVRVSDREPYFNTTGNYYQWRHSSWEIYAYSLPKSLHDSLGDNWTNHPTAEAANDALARHLPRWARARLGDAK